MERDTMEIIQDLMNELQEAMKYDSSDFDSRLGREKPDMEVVKVEGDMPMGEGAMGDDMEMAEEGPEDKLKNRIMKMRG